MAGIKYHIKNKISKREIRKNGKKIIPLSLMENKNAHFRAGLGQRRVEENIIDNKNFQGAEGGGLEY